MDRIELAPGYTISRVIAGTWQLTRGHGRERTSDLATGLGDLVQRGITTLDCADIYDDVETRLGDFLASSRGIDVQSEHPIQIHTKCVPDLDRLMDLRGSDVRRIVERSLRRLRRERIDLVQLHWWDFGIPGYVDAARVLERLRREGKVRHLGLTNFDRDHVQEIVDAGIPIVSNQVQYSLLDARPEEQLVGDCASWGIGLLCYGTLAGGLLSRRYLRAPAPREPYETRSLAKYALIVEESGGWSRHQTLVGTLETVARKHGVTLAMIASKYVLDRPGVMGVIVGAWDSAHIDEAARLARFDLDDEDRRVLRAWVVDAPGPRGPVYALERDRDGPHGRVMRYNIHAESDGAD